MNKTDEIIFNLHMERKQLESKIKKLQRRIDILEEILEENGITVFDEDELPF